MSGHYPFKDIPRKKYMSQAEISVMDGGPVAIEEYRKLADEVILYREVLEKQTRAVEKLRPHLENMDAWGDPVVTDVEAKVASLLLRYNDAARSALEGEPSE